MHCTPFLPRLKPLLCLALAAPLLSGCAHVQVALGMRVYLAKTPVTSMSAQLSGDPGLAPGQSSPLIVTFTQPSGKVLTTSGKGKGKVLWQDITLVPSVVTVNPKKGIVTLRHDPRPTDGKTGHLTISIPSHPDLKADLDVPIRYDVAFTSNDSGAPGHSGSSGLNGTSGSDGSPGSTDPNNPSAGGSGSNGTDGGDGFDGGNGGDAPPVTLHITLHPANAIASTAAAATDSATSATAAAATDSATSAAAHPLLEFQVSAPGKKDHFYLVDPHGGSLTVLANGGPGGPGGSGGRGGAGGAGGSGIPPGSSGSPGRDGNSGRDGSPGRPGSFTVFYDPAVTPYLSTLKLINPGGPIPTFHPQPTPALW